MSQGYNQNCTMINIDKSSCREFAIHFPCTYKRSFDVVKVKVNIVLTLVICTAMSFGSIGCNQAEALAKPPARPKVKPAVAKKQDKPELFVQEVDDDFIQHEDKYVLPFKPRANPFVLQVNKNSSKNFAANAVQATDIKLLGLMNDGQKPLAALEIRGRSEIVYVGSRLGSSTGVSDIRVLQIGDTDIVIEQGGKQIVISLPIPR